MFKLNEEHIENSELEIYFKYDKLDIADVALFFKRLYDLYQIILKKSFPEYKYYILQETKQSFTNYLAFDIVKTDQSLTVTFKDDWRPSLHEKIKVFPIDIPIKLGIPAILVYLLSISIQKMLKFENQTFDNQLIRLAIKLDKLEHYKKNIDDTKNKRQLYSSPSFQKLADQTLQSLVYNDNILYLEINGIKAKEDIEPSIQITQPLKPQKAKQHKDLNEHSW